MKKIIINMGGIFYCGYVIISKNHPYFGKSCNEMDDLEVYGGLTFSTKFTDEIMTEYVNKGFKGIEFLDNKDIGGWIIGFDTNRFGTNLDNWTEKRVDEELDYLIHQLEIIELTK